MQGTEMTPDETVAEIKREAFDVFKGSRAAYGLSKNAARNL
jgi:hypothetical protein